MKCRHILKLTVKVALWCFLAVASFGERFLPNDQVYRNGAFIVNIVLPLYVGYLFILIFSGWLKLEEQKEKIEVFYLPSYSPELNPDERLNADLKHAITTSVPRRTKEGLLKKTNEHMTMIQSLPERVKSYFKDKYVSYALDSQ